MLGSMTELSRAAALLGKKGGEVKGPKGFSKSGKASEAGKKAMLNRWGKQIRVQAAFYYLPSREEAIRQAGGQPSLRGSIRKLVDEALAPLVQLGLHVRVSIPAEGGEGKVALKQPRFEGHIGGDIRRKLRKENSERR